MKPAFVLGIDGLPYTLTMRLIDECVMPNMGELIKSGTFAQMDTTIPDFSCVAWTSFATGVNPGKHGIYGFQDFSASNGDLMFPTNQDCKAPALWHEVGKAGGRSIVLNLPGTYPATPLRGKMVAGFVAPEFEKACYPAAFAHTLKALNYRMDLDGTTMGSPARVTEALNEVFNARKQAIRHLIKNENWDLCIAVITETDRLQHYFLHILDDPSNPNYRWVRSFYIELDKFIGEVADLLAGRAELYMVSDHGFQVVDQTVVLEPFLHELGLAAESKEPCWKNPQAARKTKVFTLDPGRFYINRKDSRFPYGCVEEDEVADILATITDALYKLTDQNNNNKIVSVVKQKQDAFTGDQLSYAPDLVAATNPGYYFKSYRVPKDSDILETKWEANHVWNDAMCFVPYARNENNRPKIWDLLPSVLARMGVALPADLDGNPF